jgi:hypothetical protein
MCIELKNVCPTVLLGEGTLALVHSHCGISGHILETEVHFIVHVFKIIAEEVVHDPGDRWIGIAQSWWLGIGELIYFIERGDRLRLGSGKGIHMSVLSGKMSALPERVYLGLLLLKALEEEL